MIPTFVATPGGGAIGAVYCPGAPFFDSDALRRDLEGIRDAGATALVSLITDEENGLPAPGEIGAVATELGLDWHWLPLRDMTAPDHTFEEQWRASGVQLRSRLRAGERIVVHCRGGLGRAGTIAARLLVELGLPPEEAMLQIRNARPGAIQTQGQEEHIRHIPCIRPGPNG